jgi:hypothetical protein
MTIKKMYTIDIETDGLLDNMTTIHCAVAKDYKTGVFYKFGPEQIKEFVKLIDGQVVIGHNIINFDIPALETWVLDEMMPELLPVPEMVIDTLVLSRLLNPDRERPEGLPQKVGPHSLQAWGYRVGTYKGDYGKQQAAFDEYNEDMLSYCKQDVEVTEQVYKHLLKEMQE